MNLDKEIIYKIVKDFIYNNPNYDNRSIIETFSGRFAMITDLDITQLEYNDNPTDTPFDMYGSQYVPGTGGYINVWVKIIYGSDSRPTNKREFLRILYPHYLSEVRNASLSNMGITISDKIKKSLDSYLEFDSSDLFIPDLTKVFGGAIRDIIADMPIHDIDIISAPRSLKRLESILESKGYHYVEGLNPKDLSSVYTDIKVICEPRTYIKDRKIVQIIRPSGDATKLLRYSESMDRLISNVDISCCGVSYDGTNLIENVKDAILHCRNKVYKVNFAAEMTHRNRLDHRKAKLNDRGWEEIEGGVATHRDIKIDEVLKSDTYKDGYYDHIKAW